MHAGLQMPALFLQTSRIDASILRRVILPGPRTSQPWILASLLEVVPVVEQQLLQLHFIKRSSGWRASDGWSNWRGCRGWTGRSAAHHISVRRVHQSAETTLTWNVFANEAAELLVHPPMKTYKRKPGVSWSLPPALSFLSRLKGLEVRRGQMQILSGGSYGDMVTSGDIWSSEDALATFKSVKVAHVRFLMDETESKSIF